MVMALVLCACALNPRFEEARRLIDAGEIEEGLARIERLEREQPGNVEIRAYAASQRERAVARGLTEADVLRGAGALEQAEAAYRRVQRLAPGNVRAANGLTQIDAERRADGQVKLAETALARGDLAGAEARLRDVVTELPNHRAARVLARRVAERQAALAPAADQKLGSQFLKPINLEFREANLRQVFEIISRAHGVNFVFDKDVRPDIRVTIFVRDTSIEDVIKLILATNQLERRILNPTSLLIYPNTPAKAKEYLELVTRSFYLGNADAKQTLNMIRSLVKTRDVFIDEKLNLLIMRDTPAAVRYAEKLILAQDLAEPEVMLEVEVLEVSSSRLKELGVRFPDRINFGPLGAAGATSPTQFEYSSGQLQALVANPAFILNLKLQEGMTNVLANPRIRVRNREKARVHIGEKVPVITTTSTANVGVSSAVNYLEVGLKLDVEPNVYLEDEIAIKVGLEVSNILETLDIQGTRAYRLGTRNAMTTLRLRDGETQVLAGLIQDEDRRSANKVPGLGELPVLGRLFTSSNDAANKSEIVLLITPRVVRNLVRPEARYAEIPSGTEAAVGAAPLTMRPSAAGAVKLASTQGGGAKPEAAPAPAPKPSVADLTWMVPSQVAIGAELTLRVGFADAFNLRRAAFEVAFDPGVLQLLGPAVGGGAAPAGSAGRAAVSFDLAADPGGSTRDLRFRVIAQQPASTRVAIQNVTAIGADDAPIATNVPQPQTIAIVRP